MKNLENYGVQELDAKELKETDGGIIPFIIIGAALLLGGCAATRNTVGYDPNDGGGEECCYNEDYEYVDCP